MESKPLRLDLLTTHATPLRLPDRADGSWMRKGQKGSRLTVSHVDTSTGEGDTLHNPRTRARSDCAKAFLCCRLASSPSPRNSRRRQPTVAAAAHARLAQSYAVCSRALPSRHAPTHSCDANMRLGPVTARRRRQAVTCQDRPIPSNLAPTGKWTAAPDAARLVRTRFAINGSDALRFQNAAPCGLSKGGEVDHNDVDCDAEMTGRLMERGCHLTPAFERGCHQLSVGRHRRVDLVTVSTEEGNARIMRARSRRGFEDHDRRRSRRKQRTPVSA